MRKACSLSAISVVSAVLTGDRLRAFEELVDGSNGAFEGRAGPREKRLRALLALRTMAATMRGKTVGAAQIPAWARGRLPASNVRTESIPRPLPAGAKAAVDAAITAPILDDDSAPMAWCDPWSG